MTSPNSSNPHAAMEACRTDRHGKSISQVQPSHVTMSCPNAAAPRGIEVVVATWSTARTRPWCFRHICRLRASARRIGFCNVLVIRLPRKRLKQEGKNWRKLLRKSNRIHTYVVHDSCVSVKRSRTLKFSFSRSLKLRIAKRCKYQCFGHGRQKHGRLRQRVLFYILAQYVVQRDENAVNASVLGMVTKGMDACDNVSCSTSLRSEMKTL